MKTLTMMLLAVALAACGNKPRQPDWLVNADAGQDRFERAYLSGRDVAASSEFTRLMRDLSSTADVGLVARGELTRCAVQVASLEFGDCAGFERLRADAPAAERAYANFLAGTATAADDALLPAPYRGIATGAAVDVTRIESPLSRLVAAGVLMRMNRAGPQVLQAAADVASEQGWRRAVLAWLAAQVVAAERTGDVERARGLRRRMELAAQP